MENKILETYQMLEKNLDDYKFKSIEEIVIRLERYGKPLHIGNILYSVTTYPNTNDKTFGYCYDNDTKGDFLPCYDKDQTLEYGWVNFEEVARLIYVVSKKLEQFGY